MAEAMTVAPGPWARGVGEIGLPLKSQSPCRIRRTLKTRMQVTAQLQLGVLLERHQVQDADVNRPPWRCRGAPRRPIRLHPHALLLEQLEARQLRVERKRAPGGRRPPEGALRRAAHGWWEARSARMPGPDGQPPRQVQVRSHLAFRWGAAPARRAPSCVFFPDSRQKKFQAHEISCDHFPRRSAVARQQQARWTPRSSRPRSRR